MRIIDRYICRQVFSHALLGLTVFTFVFFEIGRASCRERVYVLV